MLPWHWIFTLRIYALYNKEYWILLLHSFWLHLVMQDFRKQFELKIKYNIVNLSSVFK